MQVEKWMLEPANCVPNTQQYQCCVGLTKLEWMAGTVIKHAVTPQMGREFRKEVIQKMADYAVEQAIAVLRACHDAGTETEGE